MRGLWKESSDTYMHSLVYHVPAMMRRHNGIKQFTGQGKQPSEMALLQMAKCKVLLTGKIHIHVCFYVVYLCIIFLSRC